MTTSNETPQADVENSNKMTSRVFTDPVGYLASLGVESELVETNVLPAAA